MAEYEDYSDLLGDLNKGGRTDVKFNIFKYQDHILRWISIVADSFYLRDYPSAFEALQNLYIDVSGFFSEEEKNELDEFFEVAYSETCIYIAYNVNYKTIKTKIKTQTYSPPSSIYYALLAFRFKLMAYMAQHQLLIPQVRKSYEGVASQ